MAEQKTEKPTVVGYITVPVYGLRENHLAGLRMNMLEAGPHAVATGTGLGSDGVWLEVGEEKRRRYLYARGVDMLAATLHLIGDKDAERLPTSEHFSLAGCARPHDA